MLVKVLKQHSHHQSLLRKVHRRNSVLGATIGLKKLGNKGGWDWLVALYLSSLGRYLSPDLK